MKKAETPKLYKQYFVEKHDERRELFEKLAELYRPKKAIYPGSFVHITPSFYIGDMTYIDSDRRVSKFFADDNVLPYIRENKSFEGEPSISGIQADYSDKLPIEKEAFDMMFSFYAGFFI